MLKSAFRVIRGAPTLDTCSPISEHLSRWKNSCALCWCVHVHALSKWTRPVASAAARLDSHSTTTTTTTATVFKHKGSMTPCPNTDRHFLCCRFHHDIKRRPSSCDSCGENEASVTSTVGSGVTSAASLEVYVMGEQKKRQDRLLFSSSDCILKRNGDWELLNNDLGRFLFFFKVASSSSPRPTSPPLLWSPFNISPASRGLSPSRLNCFLSTNKLSAKEEDSIVDKERPPEADCWHGGGDVMPQPSGGRCGVVALSGKATCCVHFSALDGGGSTRSAVCSDF